MPYPELEHRVALITGAARGIGFNIARCLARNGCNVWIGDVDSNSGLTACDSLRNAGLAANYLEVDLSDRKSTRLNSSHGYISYAVFCLKKKKNQCYNAQRLA